MMKLRAVSLIAFCVMHLLGAAAFAQKPMFYPQVHEIGLQIGSIDQVSPLSAYYASSPAASLNFANGIRYKYHITYEHALRAAFSYRTADFDIPEGIDRFTSYSAEKKDYELQLGYEYKYNIGPATIFFGADGMFGRGSVNDSGILIGDIAQEPVAGEYRYTNYGAAGIVGFRVFFNRYISLSLEGQAYYLRNRHEQTAEDLFYLLPESEYGVRGSAYLSFHFKKMPKRCTCPRH
jgi:hypothetical protein